MALRTRKYRTAESYREEVRELTGGEYEVVGEFAVTRLPIVHRHNCGYEWYVRPNQFVSGETRCPNCAGNAKKDSESYREEMIALVGEEYTLLGEYAGSLKPVLHRHNTEGCGHEWETRPNSFLRRSRCPKCDIATRAAKQRKSHGDYVAEVIAQVGEEYTIIGRYVNADTPILHRHNVDGCGHEWEIRPYSFVNSGSRCPRCNESKGERRVAVVLDSLGVSYEREFHFPDCRDKRTLPFDFAIHTADGPIIVEYDGEQHARPVGFFATGGGFAGIRRRDRIKTEYCRTNGIPLIRIPYTEFDRIGEILNEKLTKFNVSSESGNRSIAG